MREKIAQEKHSKICMAFQSNLLTCAFKAMLAHAQKKRAFKEWIQKYFLGTTNKAFLAWRNHCASIHKAKMLFCWSLLRHYHTVFCQWRSALSSSIHKIGPNSSCFTLSEPQRRNLKFMDSQGLIICLKDSGLKMNYCRKFTA